MIGRRILIRLAVGAAVGAGAAGVIWFRPDLVPAWARVTGRGHPGAPEGDDPAEGPSRPAETVDDGWCAAQGKADPACRARLPLIVLDSAETAGRIGLETGTARALRHRHVVVGNAEIAYAAHSFAEVMPRVSGRIREIPVDEGDHVTKGQVLVVVDSAEVAADKAQYLAALATFELARINAERSRNLAASEAASAKTALEAIGGFNRANADLLNTKQRLRNLGFRDADLDRIAREKETTSLLNVVAPIDGFLVERHAVLGEAVEPTTRLFADTDVNHMWCWIDVSEADIARVRKAQPVTFAIAGAESAAYAGEVELIDFAVNPRTRTVRVRAELHNEDGRLRANQFGRAEIRVDAEHETVVVPRAAVQVVDDRPMAFLPQPDGRTFRPQRLRLGEGDAAEVEVTWGLKAGQRVVTTGSFLLKSELQKDSIAGD